MKVETLFIAWIIGILLIITGMHIKLIQYQEQLNKYQVELKEYQKQVKKLDERVDKALIKISTTEAENQFLWDIYYKNIADKERSDME